MPKGSAGLVAEFLVHPLLHLGVETTEAAFAFFSVAVVAADDCVSEGVNVGGGLGAFAGEFGVDACLYLVIEVAELAAAFVSVAVVASDDCVG